MKKIVLIALNIFDFFHKRKIATFLKKSHFTNFKLILDIGAHKGESIDFFLTHFSVEKIISFEASPINFKDLEKKLPKKIKSFKKSEIILENLALGNMKGISKFNQLSESSSSTLNELNLNSRYLKKKKKFLNFFSNENYLKTIDVNVNTLSNYLSEKNIGHIDLIKIDTEGSELNVLLGLNSLINNVKLVFFEHHYDDMVKKNYTFSEINNFLIVNNFKKLFKIKMPFRKSFEYIYVNLSHL